MCQSNLLDVLSALDTASVHECAVLRTGLQMFHNAVSVCENVDHLPKLDCLSLLKLCQMPDDRIRQLVCSVVHAVFRVAPYLIESWIHEERELLNLFMDAPAEVGGEWTLFALKFIIVQGYASLLLQAFENEPSRQLLVLCVIDNLSETNALDPDSIHDSSLAILSVLNHWLKHNEDVLLPSSSNSFDESLCISILETSLDALSHLTVELDERCIARLMHLDVSERDRGGLGSDVNGFGDDGVAEERSGDCDGCGSLDLLALLLSILDSCAKLDVDCKRSCRSLAGLKVRLVRVLANLSYCSRAVCDRVGQMGGIELLLSQSHLDEKNPYLREWVLLTIRNLTSNHVENQKRIADLQLQDVQNEAELREAGINVRLDPKTGKVKVSTLKK